MLGIVNIQLSLVLMKGLMNGRHMEVLIPMVVSIEELRMTAMNLRKEGLNSQQIADEL